MGPRAGLNGCGKSRPHRDSIPRSYLVAIPTTTRLWSEFVGLRNGRFRIPVHDIEGVVRLPDVSDYQRGICYMYLVKPTNLLQGVFIFRKFGGVRTI